MTKNVETPNVQQSNVKDRLLREQRKLRRQRIFSNRMLMFGSSVLTVLVLIAVFGPMLTPYGALEVNIDNRLQAPSSTHILGTDEFGRDLATRLFEGARVSIGIGLMVSVITAVLGTVIGLCASYYKTLDNILMRIMDGLMAFPSILLAIALMAALGPKMSNVVLALTIVFTPYIARVVRSAALAVKEEAYIDAIRSQGASDFRILVRHIAPNVMSPMIVQATFIFADAIINEASLSFLGAGVPAPEPSLGSILHDGKMVIFNSPWMIIFSGVLIILSVLALNLLGDGIRDFLDPHVKGISRHTFRFRRISSSRKGSTTPLQESTEAIVTRRNDQ